MSNTGRRRKMRKILRARKVREFAANLEKAKLKVPALYAHAEIIFQKRTAEDGRPRAHPEECGRCKGSGVFSWQGRERFCGCPAGDRAMTRPHDSSGETTEPTPPVKVNHTGTKSQVGITEVA